MAEARKDEPERARGVQLPADDKDKPRRAAPETAEERKKAQKDADDKRLREEVDRREEVNAAERKRQDDLREEQQTRERLRVANELAAKAGDVPVRNVDNPDVCKTPMPEGEEPPPGGPLPGAPGSGYI